MSKLKLDFLKTSDQELVILALKNQDDFIYIVEKYKERLLRYIQRMTNVREEEIEDILQNIFIKTYLNLNDFDHNLSFSSWIYRIAHNEIIDNYRRLKARPQLLDVDIKDSHIKESVSDDNFLNEIMSQEEIGKIRFALTKLDIKYQEIIILKFLEEKDYQEIADIIKKPLGTVASRLNKAKKELRKELVL
ncbi:MAG: hypothetical protein PWQ35_428 [Patescibacteria group bacterium]|nr:hypothetical protein [Patescibacteria group bacterium]